MKTFVYPFGPPGCDADDGKPVLPIVLCNPANGFEFETWGLIDTGADSSVVPENIAKILYHDIRNAKAEREVNFGLGGAVAVFMHSFDIHVRATDKKGKITSKIAAKMTNKKIAVAPKLHTVILGESDFLKNFILTIDYPNRVFSLTIP